MHVLRSEKKALIGILRRASLLYKYQHEVHLNEEPTILYEDDALVVINKPAGLVVNRAESVKEPTVQDWFEKKYQITNFKNHVDISDFISRSGVVHRIDKETSGCLILAKTPKAFYRLQTQFKEHKVQKTYLALLHGKLVPAHGEIRVPVGRLPWNRERFGVVPGGKEAMTRYMCLNFYQRKSGDRVAYYTYVEAYPQSGRTHQIRVHFKYLGYPLVSDYLYAGRKQQRDDRTWCSRVFLHAARIKFFHPVDGKLIETVAPLPRELQTVLDELTPC